MHCCVPAVPTQNFCAPTYKSMNWIKEIRCDSTVSPANSSKIWKITFYEQNGNYCQICHWCGNVENHSTMSCWTIVMQVLCSTSSLLALIASSLSHYISTVLSVSFCSAWNPYRDTTPLSCFDLGDQTSDLEKSFRIQLLHYPLVIKPVSGIMLCHNFLELLHAS